nr:hypothetical protein [Gordonia oryzae]
MLRPRWATLRTGVTTSAGAVFVVMSLLITACGGDGGGVVSGTSSSSVPVPTSNVYLDQRSQGVTHLLDSLSTALRSGTPDQLAALVDPSVNPSLRARLQTVQDNLSVHADTGRGKRLRLREFRYQLAPTEEVETLVGADVQARLDQQGSSDTWVAPVELHVALGGASTPGIDEDEVVIDTQLVVARYDDTWKLVGDSTLAGEPTPSAQMWDLPELAVVDVPTAGGTSVIASYPESAEDAAAATGAAPGSVASGSMASGPTAQMVARIRSLLPGAIAAVSAFWGTGWPQRSVVVSTAADDQFHALAASATDTAAAATIYAHLDLSAGSVTGQRVLLTPVARDLPAPALGVVLRHELTHVATRAHTATTAPMWLTEGVAEYVGRKGTYTRPADAAPDLAAAVQAGDTPADLPTDHQFSVDAVSSRLAYQSAWSVATFVAAAFGEPRLRALYVAVGASSDDARADAALSATLGITRAQFVARWRAWLTAQLR